MLETHIVSLDKIQSEALKAIRSAKSLKAMDEIRVKYLGKKSVVNSVMRGMKDLTPLEKPILGQRANVTKETLQKAVSEKLKELEQAEVQGKINKEGLDVTLPGLPIERGRSHPLTRIIEEVEDIFISMGFTVEDGPEIEDDFHNFEALNIPPHHPARDMHDTFYLPGERLLRTHTSPVQVRAMQRNKPPLAVISVGKVYRVDQDPTHSPMFQQVEGFMIDKKITFGNLKGALHQFITTLFGEEKEVRFRPSYFPFTEPSAEMDVKWQVSREIDGVMTEVEEWLEILGAGMIHPEVMRYGGYDPNEYTGFAFGAGIERLALLKYGLKNLRVFFENDVRFLKQF